MGSRAAVSQAANKVRGERCVLQDGNVREMERDFQVGEKGRSGRMLLQSRSIYIAHGSWEVQRFSENRHER